MSLSLVGKMKGLLFVSVPAYDSGLEALNFYQVQFYPFFFFSFMDNTSAVVPKAFLSNPNIAKIFLFCFLIGIYNFVITFCI